MKSKAFKTNCGDTRLLSKDEWIPASAIRGSDADIIFASVIKKAFNRILEDFKPTKNIAFCSLCTVTRPYSTGRKWKLYKELFAEKCDLIVTSNGGVIPLEYEECYPFMTYDAPGNPEQTPLYVAMLHKRLNLFFRKHRYDYVLFNYRPTLRNVFAARATGPELKTAGIISDFKILPTSAQYQQSRKEHFAKKGFSMFPELYPTMLNPVINQIEEWSKC